MPEYLNRKDKWDSWKILIRAFSASAIAVVTFVAATVRDHDVRITKLESESYTVDDHKVDSAVVLSKIEDASEPPEWMRQQLDLLVDAVIRIESKVDTLSDRMTRVETKLEEK